MKAAFTKTLVWSSQVDIFNNARFTESNCIFECHTCFMHLPPPPKKKNTKEVVVLQTVFISLILKQAVIWVSFLLAN